jgi:hypothetical protein
MPENLPAQQKPTGTDLVAGVPKADIAKMESICDEFSIDKIMPEGGTERFAPAFMLAEGIKQLHAAITPAMMKPIMFLQGNQLGFLTDKDRDGGYDEKTVKNCLIQALLMGARPVGNEFNIISMKTYLTLNKFVRAVKELPGVTDFDPHLYLKAADVKEGTTIDVNYKATWKLNGAAQSIEGSIPVRINARMGADAALGKARRKMLALVVQKITGTEHTMPEGDVNDCDIPGAPAAGVPLTAGRRKIGGTPAVDASKAVDAETVPVTIVPPESMKHLRELADVAGIDLDQYLTSLGYKTDALPLDAFADIEAELTKKAKTA